MLSLARSQEKKGAKMEDNRSMSLDFAAWPKGEIDTSLGYPRVRFSHLQQYLLTFLINYRGQLCYEDYCRKTHCLLERIIDHLLPNIEKKNFSNMMWGGNKFMGQVYHNIQFFHFNEKVQRQFYQDGMHVYLLKYGRWALVKIPNENEEFFVIKFSMPNRFTIDSITIIPSKHIIFDLNEEVITPLEPRTSEEGNTGDKQSMGLINTEGENSLVKAGKDGGERMMKTFPPMSVSSNMAKELQIELDTSLGYPRVRFADLYNLAQSIHDKNNRLEFPVVIVRQYRRQSIFEEYLLEAFRELFPNSVNLFYFDDSIVGSANMNSFSAALVGKNFDEPVILDVAYLNQGIDEGLLIGLKSQEEWDFSEDGVLISPIDPEGLALTFIPKKYVIFDSDVDIDKESNQSNEQADLVLSKDENLPAEEMLLQLLNARLEAMDFDAALSSVLIDHPQVQSLDVKSVLADRLSMVCTPEFIAEQLQEVIKQRLQDGEMSLESTLQDNNSTSISSVFRQQVINFLEMPSTSSILIPVTLIFGFMLILATLFILFLANR